MAVKSLHQAIRESWDAFNTQFELDANSIGELSPKCQELEARARHFEKILSDNITPYVDQFNAGLISADELVVALHVEAAKTVGV